MNLQDDDELTKYTRDVVMNSSDMIEEEEVTGSEDEDTDPPLDEEDLEQNNLTVEEADQIEWEPAETGSAGSEEKDITD